MKPTGPCQVWSWDITYLRGPVRGSFYYLYMIEDVWSRKIVGWQIHENESPERREICRGRGAAGSSKTAVLTRPQRERKSRNLR